LEHCTSDLKRKDLAQWRWPEAWKPGDLWNVYRYHLADPIPFRKSLRVTIEHGWQNNKDPRPEGVVLKNGLYKSVF
jgi:hypothetical protein